MPLEASTQGGNGTESQHNDATQPLTRPRILSVAIGKPAAAALSALLMGLLVAAMLLLKVPNPNMILVAGLVVCSAIFEYAGGLTAGAIMMAYTLYFFSEGHNFVSFSELNFQKVFVTFVGVLVVTFFVCSLRHAENRAFRALENATLQLMDDNALLESASAIDTLTGLRNRFSLRRDYQSYVDRHEDLLVMMIDLDEFKHYNDTFGHEVGDYVLDRMGHAISNVFGANGSYRYGGDEFLVILPAAELTMLSEKSKRLSEAAEKIALGSGSNPVHFSAGYVHGVPLLPSDLRRMFRQADLKLYEAKSAGKNQMLGAAYDRSASVDMPRA